MNYGLEIKTKQIGLHILTETRNPQHLYLNKVNIAEV